MITITPEQWADAEFDPVKFVDAMLAVIVRDGTFTAHTRNYTCVPTEEGKTLPVLMGEFHVTLTPRGGAINGIETFHGYGDTIEKAKEDCKIFIRRAIEAEVNE